MKVYELFDVVKGEGDYRENLDVGKTPLVSATNLNNGVIDFVNIEPTFKAPIITVERVSGQAYVQLLDFATVPDDISILLPKKEMSLQDLYFSASQINLQKWRYSYGRKLTPTRLKNMDVENPIDFVTLSKLNLKSRFPKSNKKVKITIDCKYKLFSVLDLFTIDKGDFHALDRLDIGNVPTVSRISINNGITGFFEKPTNSKTYKKGLITVSTVSGDAFVQLDDFMATDNVLICKPKINFSLPSLFFVAYMINMQKWRYSYGRQPYKRVFSKLHIYLPVQKDIINQDKMGEIVKNCYGWDLIEQRLFGS